jgi:hypothetical protein
MEEEQLALKKAVQADRETRSADVRRIEELEKQMAALAEKLKASRTKKAKIEGKSIQVIDDVDKAVKEGLGYFSLSTSNPTKARVYLKNNYIGTTPLVNLLIEEGMQEFHIMDADGQRRRFVRPIARGEKNNFAVDIKNLQPVNAPR